MTEAEQKIADSDAQKEWEEALNAPMTPEREAACAAFEKEMKEFVPPPQPIDLKLTVECDSIYTEEELRDVLDDIGCRSQKYIGPTVRIEKILDDDGNVIKEIHYKQQREKR